MPEPNLKRRKPCVLVVDDDQSIRDWLRRYLTILGCDCVLAGTGEDALMQLDSVVPDLVLLDVTLPGMGGFQTLSRLQEKCPQVPLTILAVREDVPAAQQALSYGARDYLAKPIELDNLKKAVQPLLSIRR